ncbi:MAG TPA: PH domain-containing protein [Candidatus Saccharimonadales bacterium]|nr:PH domain-containing protein [Candidatus Saccharimonadales bacterium]
MLRTLLKSAIKDPTRTVYDGQDSDEQVLYVLRKSFITNVHWIFASLVLLGITLVAHQTFSMLNLPSVALEGRLQMIFFAFWYLFTFGFIFQNFINWYFNVYLVTSKKIIDMDFYTLTYKKISECPLRNVEDVTSKVQGLGGVIFNIGDVLIQTAAEQGEFNFESIDNPSRIRDAVSDLVTAIHEK